LAYPAERRFPPVAASSATGSFCWSSMTLLAPPTTFRARPARERRARLRGQERGRKRVVQRGSARERGGEKKLGAMVCLAASLPRTSGEYYYDALSFRPYSLNRRSSIVEESAAPFLSTCDKPCRHRVRGDARMAWCPDHSGSSIAGRMRL